MINGNGTGRNAYRRVRHYLPVISTGGADTPQEVVDKSFRFEFLPRWSNDNSATPAEGAVTRTSQRAHMIASPGTYKRKRPHHLSKRTE